MTRSVGWSVQRCWWSWRWCWWWERGETMPCDAMQPNVMIHEPILWWKLYWRRQIELSHADLHKSDFAALCFWVVEHKPWVIDISSGSSLIFWSYDFQLHGSYITQSTTTADPIQTKIHTHKSNNVWVCSLNYVTCCSLSKLIDDVPQFFQLLTIVVMHCFVTLQPHSLHQTKINVKHDRPSRQRLPVTVKQINNNNTE